MPGRGQYQAVYNPIRAILRVFSPLARPIEPQETPVEILLNISIVFRIILEVF